LKDGFVVNTILKEADLFCPNSVRINFTIYLIKIFIVHFFAITLFIQSKNARLSARVFSI
ncbi:hypothetical protein, partial [Latilactobacillus curvatus]|uniref:hypothetical protein n=1 Tax=Latilactobacillus curvatus TaxID=28038 RepID=UPI00223BCADB